MIPCTQTAAITIAPNAVRYSLAADRIGGAYSSSSSLTLQRAERREDGTWLDDPREGAAMTIALPESCQSAVDGLLLSLPAVFRAKNPAITLHAVGDVRLDLRGVLDAQRRLDVSITVQASLGTDGDQWLPVLSLPSLNETLTAHPEIAPALLSAWAVLDAAITAHIAAEGTV